MKWNIYNSADILTGMSIKTSLRLMFCLDAFKGGVPQQQNT